MRHPSFVRFIVNFTDFLDWIPDIFRGNEYDSRSDFDSPFKVYYRVPFGTDNVEEVNLPPTGKEKVERNPANVVFVGNLPFTCTPQDLEQLFTSKGFQTVSVSVPTKEGRSKGFGFVEFSSTEDKNKALTLDRQLDLSGRMLSVQPSK